MTLCNSGLSACVSTALTIPMRSPFQGDLHAIVDEYEPARVLYARAIARDPGLAHGYYSLGVVLDKLGEAEKALGAYEQAVKLTPEHGPIAVTWRTNTSSSRTMNRPSPSMKKCWLSRLTLCCPISTSPTVIVCAGELEEALRSQQKGASLLRQVQIARLEKNQQPWYFRVSDLSLHLEHAGS